MKILFLVATQLLLLQDAGAFLPSSSTFARRTAASPGSPSHLFASEDDDGDDNAIQWELFQKYHNKGSWKGIWTTYDYMGDVSLETIASVDYKNAIAADTDGAEPAAVDVSHTIVVGATKSNCATCFDDMETRTIPVAQYTPTNFAARKTRLGACGMVVVPSLLRNGASEFILCVNMCV